MNYRFLLPLLLLALCVTQVSAQVGIPLPPLDTTRVGGTLTWDDTLFNFGMLAPIGVVGHDFRLRNAGKDTLFLFDAKASCGCTHAPLRKRIIAPGDTVALTIYFNTQGQQGQVHKYLNLMTSDPAHHIQSFHLSALTDTGFAWPIGAAPWRVDFGRDTLMPLATLHLMNQFEGNLTFKLIDAFSLPGKVTMPEGPIKSGKGADVLLVIPAAELQGKQIVGSLTIEADDPGRHRVTIGLLGGE